MVYIVEKTINGNTYFYEYVSSKNKKLGNHEPKFLGYVGKSLARIEGNKERLKYNLLRNIRKTAPNKPGVVYCYNSRGNLIFVFAAANIKQELKTFRNVKDVVTRNTRYFRYRSCQDMEAAKKLEKQEIEQYNTIHNR